VSTFLMRPTVAVTICFAFLCACSSGTVSPLDGSTERDSGPARDAAAPDARSQDAGFADATVPDAVSMDAAAPDAISSDAEPPDAISRDAEAQDAIGVDVGPPDVGQPDAGFTYSSTIVREDFPRMMEPGRTATVSVVLRNTGTGTWLASSAFELASENTPPDLWGVDRGTIERDVLATETTTVTLVIRAPMAEGNYRHRWRMEGPMSMRFGAAIDLPVRVERPVYASCDAVPRGSPSGAYLLQTGGTIWETYCEMVEDGGGWTLILKADGNQRTFEYDSPLWTTTATLGSDPPDLSPVEAKLVGFNNLPFTEMRLGMTDGAITRWVVISARGASMLNVLSRGFVATSAGRSAWYGLLASASLQPNCNLEGFNIEIRPWALARIGIVGNNENECSTPDSRLGFGIGRPNIDICNSADQAATTVGNVATDGPCGADNGFRNTRAFGYVFVR
jgi:hypothetical protein